MEDWNAVDILVAEDDDFDAELTLRALRKIGEDYRILRVKDGVEALQFVLREGPFAQRDKTLPKLILLDLDMPRAGGMQVLRRLRDNAPTKEIPVGILTSSTKHADYFETQELKAWDYLVKPVSTEALMDLVKQIGL
jgi:CheY-like chemotaxis protein